jgi:hypothetical protein
MVADKKLSPQGKQDIGREGKSKMKRRMLLSIFLICIILISAPMMIFKVSPRELFLGWALAGYVLMQKPPPMPTPSELFIEHLLDPIPESVTNIKADKPKEIWGYTYTLRFNINRADMELLIESGALERIRSAKYNRENGRIELGWDRTSPNGIPIRLINAIVYGSRREPRWFRPDQWDNPEAYASEKERDGHTITKILLFNEKEGEAYFIVSRYRS